MAYYSQSTSWAKCNTSSLYTSCELCRITGFWCIELEFRFQILLYLFQLELRSGNVKWNPLFFLLHICYSTLMLLGANLSKTKWYKNLENDWNPGTWVLIWEFSVRAFQWILTLQGFCGFLKSLRPCPLDESSLSIGRVKTGSEVGNGTLTLRVCDQAPNGEFQENISECY